MRCALDGRLPRHRYRNHKGMQGKDVDQAEHAVLVKQHEAHQHEAAGEQVREIQCEAIHHTPRETKRSNAASRPSMRAAPRKSDTRKTRILAVTVSKTANRKPPAISLIA